MLQGNEKTNNSKEEQAKDKDWGLQKRKYNNFQIHIKILSFTHQEKKNENAIEEIFFFS